MFIRVRKNYLTISHFLFLHFLNGNDFIQMQYDIWFNYLHILLEFTTCAFSSLYEIFEANILEMCTIFLFIIIVHISSLIFNIKYFVDSCWTTVYLFLVVHCYLSQNNYSDERNGNQWKNFKLDYPPWSDRVKENQSCFTKNSDNQMCLGRLFKYYVIHGTIVRRDTLINPTQWGTRYAHWVMGVIYRKVHHEPTGLQKAYTRLVWESLGVISLRRVMNSSALCYEWFSFKWMNTCMVWN